MMPPPTQSIASVPTTLRTASTRGIPATRPRPTARAIPTRPLASAAPTSSAFTMSATRP